MIKDKLLSDLKKANKRLGDLAFHLEVSQPTLTRLIQCKGPIKLAKATRLANAASAMTGQPYTAQDFFPVPEDPQDEHVVCELITTHELNPGTMGHIKTKKYQLIYQKFDGEQARVWFEGSRAGLQKYLSNGFAITLSRSCLLYTSPSPRDRG